MAGRFIVIVLDSVGIGEMPDAAQYGDAGSSTLGNLARAVGGLKLPNFERLGLGNIGPIQGVPEAHSPRVHSARWPRLARQGHHHRPLGDDGRGAGEAAGALPQRLSTRDRRRRGSSASVVGGVLGNKPASGTEIIEGVGRGAPAQRAAHPLHLGRFGLPGGVPRGDRAGRPSSTSGARRRGRSSIPFKWRA